MNVMALPLLSLSIEARQGKGSKRSRAWPNDEWNASDIDSLTTTTTIVDATERERGMLLIAFIFAHTRTCHNVVRKAIALAR